MGEVQNLKNDRVVGENRLGFLTIVRLPEDPGYAAYAQKIVRAENRDREVLYVQIAKREKEPLQVVEGEYSLLWREHAFPGEWIQLKAGEWVEK